jgi:hypothetical protein
LLNQPPCAYRATLGQHIVQRVNPLSRFQYLLTVSFRLSHVLSLRLIVLNLP